MSADPQNVIAIHCKGGKGDAKAPDLFHYHFVNEFNKDIILLVQLLKVCNVHSQFTPPLLSFTGRTGTMVCTWFIDSDQFESAQVRVSLLK